MSLIDLAKQFQSLIAGALPLATAKVSFLGFLNPQITQELWPIASVLAVIASGLTYNLARQFQKPRWARQLALWGLGVAVFTLIAMFAIVDEIALADSPALQDFSVRSLFVLLFVGTGFALGWGSTHVLR